MLERAAEMLELGLHQPSGRARQQAGDRRGRGMGAMRGGEGVVDVEIAERGELAGEGGVVFLLGGVEAQILEQRDLARRQPGDDRLGRRAAAILGEGDRAADRGRERVPHHLQRHAGHDLAVGPAEMGQHHDLGALVEQLLQRRGAALDARRVAHLAVLDRDVEVRAHQDAPAGDIEIVEGTESRHAAPRCNGSKGAA